MVAKQHTLRFTAMASLAALVIGCASPADSDSGSEPEVSGGSELVEAAQAEGSLTLYTSASPTILDQMVSRFEEKYGITVNEQRLNSGDIIQRFLAEGDSSSADMLEVPLDFFAANEDLFLKLSESEVPGYNAYPKTARVGTASVISYVSPWAVVYNTDEVSEDEVPTTWQEVAEEWEGQYLLTDPRSSDSYMAFANETEKALGSDVLTELAENKGALSDSGATAAQQVAAGEFAMSIPNYPGQVPPLEEAGAPLAYAVIQEPARVLPMSLGIPSSAPNPNAARLFLQWRMSIEAQQMTCDSNVSSSPLASTGEVTDCAVELPEGWQAYETPISEDRKDELLDDMGL